MMRALRRVAWLFIAWGLAGMRPLSAAEPVDYLRDIKPLFVQRCVACHGAIKQKNGLRLDTVPLMRRGGQSGPAIEPGHSDDSLIFDALQGVNGLRRMPPEGEPLTAAQIDLIRRWVEQGAAAPDEQPATDPARHWAFQLIKRPAVPDAVHPAAAAHPIDRFLDVARQQQGLSASPPVAKSLLLRRVYLDLIGLPPTRRELQEFLADSSAAAYEAVVDRLLASVHYGERWGRHWMDVWRYSDWDGYGAEVRESQPQIWRWRDWIIESLNADRGYDQMLVEMLAGDELAPGDPATLRATGFLVRNWHRFNRDTWLDNTVEHTAKAFLGMTLNCARCHDHKYDPIPQADYYRFRAFFEPHNIRTDPLPGAAQPEAVVRAYDADAAKPTWLYVRGNEQRPDKDHPLAPRAPFGFGGDLKIAPVALAPGEFYPGLRPFAQDAALAQARADLAAAKAALEKSRSALIAVRRKAETQPVAAAPNPAAPVASPAAGPAVELSPETQDAAAAVALAETAVETAHAAIAAVVARIVADRANYTAPPATDAQALSAAAGAAERELAWRQAEQKLRQAAQAQTLAQRAVRPGDEKTAKTLTAAQTQHAAAVKARDAALAALAQPVDNYTRFGGVYPAQSTGRRLALARWVAAPQNPLTARVAVNHIWLRHFGSPLVPTVFDFGLNGKPPTHPELLDWLAAELIDQNWQMKALHRLIVTSAAYRMQSWGGSGDGPNASRDPENRYLWRQNPRRMEAEAVRDSTLAAAGRLDRTLYGPELDQNAGLTTPRRSIYFRNSKEKRVNFLALFDGPNVVECYRRNESITPQQALAMVNSSLTAEQSRWLARALAEEFGPLSDAGHDACFIRAAFEQILARPETPAELDACRDFLAEQTRQFREPRGLTAFATGTASTLKPAADPHQRALENLVHVLFNHNDFLTIR